MSAAPVIPIKPYDDVSTDADLDAIFPAQSERPAKFGGSRHLSAEPETPLPFPVRAIHARDPEPVQWVVTDLFPAGDVGLIVGDGGSFKSTSALHIAAAVAGGYKAFDRFDTDRAPVLYCSAEDPESVIQTRLEAFIRGHEWDRDRVLESVYYYAMAGMSLRSVRWKLKLREIMEEIRPALVVFDPFVDLSGLEDENDNAEASKVTTFARELAREYQAAVVFVHHAAKPKDNAGASQARIRGASAIANASRGTLFLEFTDAGVLVQQLKMSYAPRLPNFMVVRDIHSQPTNRAAWITAKLTTAKPQEVRLNRAQEVILGLITASPRTYTSSDLKKLARGEGVWAEEASRAIKALAALNAIHYDGGPKNAKLWYRLPTSSCLPNAVGNQPESCLPTLPDPLRQPDLGGGLCLPPIGGQATPPASCLPGEFDETQAEAFDS